MRSRPPSNPSNDDPRSARCAPATTSRAGRASPLSPTTPPPAPRTRGVGPNTPRRKGGVSMPTYTTPTPIDLAVNLQVGVIEVVAGDRADTVVTVSPTNPDEGGRPPRRGGDQGRLRRPAAHHRRPAAPLSAWIGPTESVDVKVELPTGSRLTAEIAVGGLRTVGRLGADPHQELDGSGRRRHHRRPVAARRARQRDPGHRRGRGRDHGRPRPDPGRHGHRRRDPQGVARRHQVGESGGDLDAKLSYGDLEITRALASVAAKTAYGSIQLREVSSGSIQVESGFGQVTIGVRPGVPAWLDLSSKDGRVRNQLDGDRAPRTVRADRRGPRAHPARRHQHPARPMNSGNQQKGTHTHEHPSDRRPRAAQVLRREGRARRRRPHGGRRARSPRCSARTAPARRRPCTSCQHARAARRRHGVRERMRRRARPRRRARRDRPDRPVLRGGQACSPARRTSC